MLLQRTRRLVVSTRIRIRQDANRALPDAVAQPKRKQRSPHRTRSALPRADVLLELESHAQLSYCTSM